MTKDPNEQIAVKKYANHKKERGVHYIGLVVMTCVYMTMPSTIPIL